MDLFKSWINSLNLFKPANFKLFFLVTLNAYVQLWKVILFQWWKLLILVMAIFILVPFIFAPFSQHEFVYVFCFGLYVFFVHNILIVSFCLATCPSIHRKTAGYYIEYLTSNWFIIPLYIIIDGLIVVSNLLVANNLIMDTIFSIINAVVLIGKIIFLLFVLDRDKGYPFIGKSIRYTLHFMWYQFPLCALLGLFIIGDQFLAKLLWPNVFWLLGHLMIRLLLASLLVVILTNMYIKEIHDQSKYYFPQPS